MRRKQIALQHRRTGRSKRTDGTAKRRAIGSPATAAPPFELSERLSSLRKERGLSLATLAQRSGMSKGFLSLVERGRKAPSISTLLKLSHAYGMPIGALFDAVKSRDPAYSLVRRSERIRYAREGSLHGYRYEAVAFRKEKKRMEPFVVSVPLRTPRKFFQHEGDELLYVLKGTVEVHLGGERISLTTGDCLYFDGMTPHRSHSIGTERATTFVIVSVRT